MNSEIRIREAVKSDLPILLGFEQEVVIAERPFDPTIRESNVNYYDLNGLMDNPRATVLVACDEDKIVASGYGLEKPARHYLDHETFAYLGFMYTDPTYRGKGINGMIVNGLQDWASEMGLIEIRLHVYSDNEPAIRAYEKGGFKKHMIEMRLRTEY
ncbi:GNAT family N-acetyltransferase [Maribacter hydrothermalis]|uniref:Acetyltransferase n=1 Tax=Maribacter hydrothermalis TaxID=1836467 RepID=A0A1B7Z6D7_9FLAO|nr:GNAT family N-acetyltransferase [Maribacter hydrothermalis]APQ16500.1 GNAT family N-acetyltransferase [Maribacter hydrothermalis]OBR38236.1 acetyltransferase [Maribacter hydrothermalis]